MRIAAAWACRQNYAADHRAPSESSGPRGLRHRLARLPRVARGVFLGRSGRQRGRSVRVNLARFVALRSSRGPLGSPHSTYEVHDERRVFLPRLRFHAAANIDCVWFGGANRCGNTFRRQASGQENAAGTVCAKRHVPAKSLAASAVAATIEAVEQECGDMLVTIEFSRAE